MTHERITDWTGPTGRRLRPGKTFQVRGRRGRWRFVAYIDGAHPHVEAIAATDQRGGNVRCFRPETIYNVSTR